MSQPVGEAHFRSEKIAVCIFHIQIGITGNTPRSNADGSISLLSHKVEFVHPVSKETIIVEAPLPDDNLWRAIAP